MTRSAEEFECVRGLIGAGANDCEVSRRTGIPRSTVRGWRVHGGELGTRSRSRTAGDCPRCGGKPLHPVWYAYLLGLYLGDGCLSEHPRDVYRLRINLDLRQPEILQECKEAITAVRGMSARPPGAVQRAGCAEVYSFWKHWICLFPQHGPGRKHLRAIELDPWQEEIVRAEPGRLLRGLIHSDGCRVIINRVKVRGVRYAYPRYQFTNNSPDIRHIFCAACDAYGVRWARSNWNVVSISRGADVAKLDLVVGPKG